MTSKMLEVFAGALFLLSAGVVLQNEAATADATLTEVGHYRQWTRVTEKLIPVVNAASGGD